MGGNFSKLSRSLSSRLTSRSTSGKHRITCTECSVWRQGKCRFAHLQCTEREVRCPMVIVCCWNQKSYQVQISAYERLAADSDTAVDGVDGPAIWWIDHTLVFNYWFAKVQNEMRTVVIVGMVGSTHRNHKWIVLIYSKYYYDSGKIIMIICQYCYYFIVLLMFNL